MKKIVVVVLSILLVLVVYLVISNRGVESVAMEGAELLVANPSVLLYKIDDGFTDYGFLEYSFSDDADENWFAQGLFDINGDGKFSYDEWLIRNEIPKVTENRPSRISFTLPQDIKTSGVEEIEVWIALTKKRAGVTTDIADEDSLVASAPVITNTLVSEFGMDIEGASEDLKRGLGFSIAYAEDFDETGIDDSALPDLAGGPMDCFAIATANNLINMVNQHGKRDTLPEDPAELVGELKNFMQWNDGITNQNFMIGKREYIEVTGLPIVTEEFLRPSIDDLKEIMSSGDAFEISTTMLRSASGKANTGHVFTGVSAYQDGPEAAVAVHDPATAKGTDILDLTMTAGDEPYILVKYPMWDGIMVVDAIYVQRWIEEEKQLEEETSLQLDDGESVQEVSAGGLPDRQMGLEGSFDHVKPGEYSEVYAVVTDMERGDTITARLYGGGHTGTPQIVDADENGVSYFTWRISQYDNYEISVESSSGEKRSIKVEVN
jgi:hypothetical protein